MKRFCLLLTSLFVAVMAFVQTGRAETLNPQAVTALLDRIGGTGAADRFVTVVDEALAGTGGKDVFVITAQDGKPCIKGSSVIAVTTGINWYLNHTAHINLAWNCLTADLNTATLPVPVGEERHECEADYRYYLNYCTYSYSCAMWTEERWMQEIDWMALHGVNMPLMLIGLDVIWYDIYTSDEFGYMTEEIGKYIAGPAFQAWWGMANLEGHGGPNPRWWYERQRAMCKNMLERMRSLGMEPVLPGFYGLVPSNLATKMAGTEGYSSIVGNGRWQGYQAPGMLNASDSKFAHLAELFYAKQKEIMGKGKFFSMDLCHEGGTAPADRTQQVKGIMAALDANIGTDAVWLAQAWGITPINEIRNNVEKGRLLILDLYGETQPGSYGNHDFVYCMLLNFGGRTGLHGRFDNLVKNYNANRGKATLRGVGATPEGIENNPVMYDAVFELPWTTVEKTKWTKDYATARYGQENAVAQTALQKLMNSVYNCPGAQQGTSETVILAQPSLTVGSVSSWSTSAIPYDYRQVISAADDLLSQVNTLSGNNFEYDLLDVTRQALSDYAYHLLGQINTDYQKGGGTGAAFLQRKNQYLELIDDLDELLGSHHEYRFGNWTEMARAIVTEPAAAGAGTADADWLEYDNLRRQVSTWSDFASGLREYSNREWNGMLRDYYKPRWEEFFQALADGSGTAKFNNNYWFNKAGDWIKNKAGIIYTATPEGDTKQLAAEKFAKYFFPVTSAKGQKAYILRHITQELAVADFTDVAYRGKAYTFAIPEGTTATLAIDADNDGNITAAETLEGNTMIVPVDAVTSDVKAMLTLDDGTTVIFRLALMDEILTDRTVSVAVAAECAGQGNVGIVGEAAGITSVTNKEAVKVQATPVEGFDFIGWTQTIDGATTVAGTENPLSYYGAKNAVFTASFVENIWGIPAEEKSNDWNDIRSANSYLSSISCTQGENTTELYSTTECPDRFFNMTTGNINAARGSSFTLKMNDAGGMKYCYLSAYIDLNRDGDFDDEGELLEVRGTKGAATNNICEAPLQVILPYDMPAGLTHLRLRFDGAWKNVIPAARALAGAGAPAKADLTRMTYEIAVNISEHAQGTTHVVIRSNDESLGTVRNITGTTGEDISVPAGTEIQPEVLSVAEGCEFVHWMDQYGRIISTEPSFKIIPAENSTFTAVFKQDYPVIYKGSLANSGRNVTSVRLDEQAIAVSGVLSYYDKTSETFVISVGESVTPDIKWSGNWMHGYVYVDTNNDGQFAPCEVDDNGIPTLASELFSYSYYNGKNSLGNTPVANSQGKIDNPGVTPPAFTAPTVPGIYRIRFKTDWNSLDPVGSTSDFQVNSGTIVDATLHVHAATVNVTANKTPGINMTVPETTAFGEAFPITIERGAVVALKIKHGYRLAGESVVHKTIQWKEDSIGLEQLTATGKTYTIPDAYVDGDIEITPVVDPTVQALKYGEWTFGFEERPEGVFITEVETEGSSTLDLSTVNNLNIPLAGIQSGVFRDCVTLERIVLPDYDIALDNYLDTNFEGAGTQNATIVPAETIPGNGLWKMILTVSTDGSAFNQWGSGLLATGNDALGAEYSGGFQFYLAKAGTITMKINGSEENKFNTPVGNRFTIEMKNDGAGKITVTLIPESGKPEIKTMTSVELNDINTLCTALPAGINIEHLFIVDPTLHSQPFVGCATLTDIDVVTGNPTFSSKYGILLSADGNTLRAYPEGRYTTRAYVLKNVSDGRYVSANPPGTADGMLIANDNNNAARRITTEDVLKPMSLLQQARGSDKNLLYHLNSAGYFGGKSNSGGVGQQIEVLAAAQWAGDYAVTTLRDMDASFSAEVALQVAGFYLNSSNGKFALSDATPETDDAVRWTLQEVNELPIVISDALWTALCLPIAAIVPPSDDATVYTLARVEGDAMILEVVPEGTVLAAGEGVLVEVAEAKAVSFALSFGTETPRQENNLLDGATIERTGLAKETYYGLERMNGMTGFYISEGTIVPANKAYLKAEKLNGTPASHLRFDSDAATGIGSTAAGNAEKTDTWYDLQGRRVLYPSNGIYVNDRGEKAYFK